MISKKETISIVVIVAIVIVVYLFLLMEAIKLSDVSLAIVSVLVGAFLIVFWYGFNERIERFFKQQSNPEEPLQSTPKNIDQASQDEGANPTKTQDEYNEERDIQKILSMVPSKEDIGKQIRSQAVGCFLAPEPKDPLSKEAKEKLNEYTAKKKA